MVEGLGYKSRAWELGGVGFRRGTSLGDFASPKPQTPKP